MTPEQPEPTPRTDAMVCKYRIFGNPNNPEGGLTGEIRQLERELATLQASRDADKAELANILSCFGGDAKLVKDGVISLFALTRLTIKDRDDLRAQLEDVKRERDALTDKFRPENFIHHQATNCGKCGKHKHTPWRNDKHGYGYVCATCLVEIYDAERDTARDELERARVALEQIRDQSPDAFMSLGDDNDTFVFFAKETALAALTPQPTEKKG